MQIAFCKTMRSKHKIFFIYQGMMILLFCIFQEIFSYFYTLPKIIREFGKMYFDLLLKEKINTIFIFKNIKHHLIIKCKYKE